MAVNLINCGNAALPRSLDVSVSVSKPQAEQTTDLSVSVFVQSSGSFSHGADRIAFFSSYEAVASDARVGSEGLKAARDFFAQPKRSRLLAIAQAFSVAKAGFLKTGACGTVAAFQAVTSGSFAVSVDGVSRDITALNFSTDTTLALIAARIQTALRSGGSGGFTSCTVVVSGTQLIITSGTAGALSSVSVLGAAATGTNIAGAGFLNGAAGVGVAVNGYTPGTLDTELDLIAQAAKCGGRFVYGWALDASYRDSAAQTLAAAWAQARVAFMPLVSNSPLAWDPASTTDLGPVSKAAGQYRTAAIYHDNVGYYPDAALLAVMLSVNYGQKKSAITAKFKDLVGIPIVGLTESQWLTLDSKGYNTFTLTGNTSRVFRDGDTSNTSWYIDDLINLDNFAEQLQVAEYNVFLRNGAVGYDAEGVTLLRDAITQICERFVYNGVLAERQVLDTASTVGYRIDPPYTIEFTPLELMTVADRAARIGPPCLLSVNLRGAIHSVAINVNAYS